MRYELKCPNCDRQIFTSNNIQVACIFCGYIVKLDDDNVDKIEINEDLVELND